MDATVLKNRVVFMTSMTIIGVAVLFLVIAGWLSFVPVTIIKPNVQPYKVATPTIVAGDTFIYIADVCKFKETTSNATRTFVDEDGIRYPIASQLSNIAAGCRKNNVVVPTLPSFPAGVWHMELDVQYQVNPLRTQTYHFKTETFTITAFSKGGVQ